MADTFSGIDAIHGRLGMYTGVVQSVQDFGPDAPTGAQMVRDLCALRPAAEKFKVEHYPSRRFSADLQAQAAGQFAYAFDSAV